VVTSILRKRFTGHGRAWQWRAIHYSSYVAFVFGVLHGLLGGRAARSGICTFCQFLTRYPCLAPPASGWYWRFAAPSR
jgi:hypothetical protein